MVYASFACFVVDVEILEVVVEIDIAGAEVTTKEGRVGREHGRNVDMSLSTERDGNAGLPLVKVGNDGGVELLRDILHDARVGRAKPVSVGRVPQRKTTDQRRTWPRNHATRYPKMIESLVSVSCGGDGIPAKFQRSAFHSSRR